MPVLNVSYAEPASTWTLDYPTLALDQANDPYGYPPRGSVSLSSDVVRTDWGHATCNPGGLRTRASQTRVRHVRASIARHFFCDVRIVSGAYDCNPCFGMAKRLAITFESYGRSSHWRHRRAGGIRCVFDGSSPVSLISVGLGPGNEPTRYGRDLQIQPKSSDDGLGFVSGRRRLGAEIGCSAAAGTDTFCWCTNVATGRGTLFGATIRGAIPTVSESRTALYRTALAGQLPPVPGLNI